MPAFEAALAPQAGLSHVWWPAAPAFYRDIETVSQRDLRRAEVIVFPVALAALLLVFGSVVAALHAAGRRRALASRSFWRRSTPRDLGHGPVDLRSQSGHDAWTRPGRGLFALRHARRFREELAASGGDVPRAIERTMATAGKAVFFSGATVLDRAAGVVAVRVHVPALGRHRRGDRRLFRRRCLP